MTRGQCLWCPAQDPAAGRAPQTAQAQWGCAVDRPLWAPGQITRLPSASGTPLTSRDS